MQEHAKPAMQWLRLDDWLVLFSRPTHQLPDEGMERVLLRLRDPTLRGFLSVIDHDGHPKVKIDHLHAAGDAVDGQVYNVAVITSHRLTLALARILEWLGVSIRCFKTSELGDALDWIDVPRELHPRFFDAVERLRRNQEVPGVSVSIAD